MAWESLFTLANVWTLPFWLLLAFGPRTELMARIVLFGGVAPLAITYTLFFLLLITSQIDPVGPSGGSTDLTTLAGVMTFFASKGGATVGWIHYLTLDLLTGLWVARNADRHGYRRVVQGPILFFVLMAGPLGLFMYLTLRLFCKNSPDNAVAPS
jgi:Domain of unknown function (DUF4281)